MAQAGDPVFSKDPGRDEPIVQTMPSKEEGMKLISADWSDDELLLGRPETVEYDTTSVPEFEGERMIDYVPAVQMARLGYQAATHLPELAAYAKKHAPRDFFDGVSKVSKVVKGMAQNDPIGTALMPALGVMPYGWPLVAADMFVPWGYGSIPEHPLQFKNARELQDDTVDFADRYLLPVARKITDMTKPLTDFMLGAGKRMQRSIK